MNKNCVKINCDEKDMVLLSNVGQIVENAICHIEESYNHLVELDKHIVMPNHIHLILFLSGRKSDEGGRPMTAPTVCNCISFSALRLRKKYTVTINAMNALGTNLS